MSVEQVRKTAWKYVLDQPMRILVADDDAILREFASVYLSTPTATVVTAPDGLAALDLLKADAYDVAVIDIDMPVLDGFGLLESIRADGALSQLPVMMLTGNEDIASIDRAFTLGANGFGTKPVNWRLLSYQIRYVLRSCALERDAVTRPVGDAPVKRSSAEPGLLRERCEAILAEARRFGDGAQATASGPEVCLRRIAKLASELLAGDVSEARASGAFLVPAAVNADG
jgi:DNA-binding response OmpR family regulator